MKLPAYPKYKSSGVEWLGDVPEHWETRRIKDVGTLRGGAGFPHEDQGVEDEELPFYKVGDLKASLDGRVMGNPEHTISKETAKKLRAAIIPPDSVVYAKIGAALLLNRRRVTFVHCCIDNNMTAYLPDKKCIRSEWAFYWLSTLDFGEFMNPGAVPSFSEGYQSILPVLVPPPAEQRAIAAFLDRETGRMDRLVAKKRELIERLKEKRTALISRTVTRGLPVEAAAKAGLPANPPLKPSGLDWLGDIPKHWDIIPLRYAFYNLDYKRIPVAGEDRADVEKIYPYYGASGIIDHVEDYIFDEILILVAEDGANLLSRSTPLAFLATGKYWVNNHAHILKPVEGDIRYWAAVLQTYDYTPLVTGAAQPKLTSDRLGNIRLPKPPLHEQVAIAAYLDEETAKLDALVGKVEEAVERLQEYRTALITAAVTGKIDVREAVSKLGTVSIDT